VLVDSAFFAEMLSFFISLGEKRGETVAAGTVRRQATSVLQSTEWGMRGIQGSFPVYILSTI
jgi:hypothetical protein